MRIFFFSLCSYIIMYFILIFKTKGEKRKKEKRILQKMRIKIIYFIYLYIVKLICVCLDIIFQGKLSRGRSRSSCFITILAEICASYFFFSSAQLLVHKCTFQILNRVFYQTCSIYYMFINSIAPRKCTAGLKSNLHNNLESAFVRACNLYTYEFRAAECRA